MDILPGGASHRGPRRRGRRAGVATHTFTHSRSHLMRTVHISSIQKKTKQKKHGRTCSPPMRGDQGKTGSSLERLWGTSQDRQRENSRVGGVGWWWWWEKWVRQEMGVWEDTHSQPEWSFSVTLTPDGCYSHVIFGGGSRTKKTKQRKVKLRIH